MTREWLAISDEVREALDAGRGVVALESSLIAQGLPVPHNLETAIAAEAAVRESGAIPATVAVEDGCIVVGADRALLERLADPERAVAKAGSRDLGPLIAAGTLASTTVSATMRAAYLAGLELFATGGIGGVHRGANTTFDVSSDVDELAVTPVAVVCSGAKSILDLPATLELLETRRVPVVGYGTDELPAFYSTTSGLRVPHRVDGPAAAAAAIAAHRSIPGAGGILIVQPPPADLAIDPDEVESWIDAAMDDAEGQSIRAGALTPHLLRSLARASGGRTLARQHRSDRRQRAHRGYHLGGLDLTAGGGMLARHVRIYEGSPRQQWEEVLRSIGAFADREQLKELLVLEMEVGFILQGIGLQAGGADSDSFGSAVKRTYELTDDQVGELIDAREAERGTSTENVPHADITNYYEHAMRVIGSYIDSQKAHDVFLFEQEGSFVLRLFGVAGAAWRTSSPNSRGTRSWI